MEFRLAHHPKEFPQKIQHQDLLFLMGSCFTEQIGKKLSDHKFRMIDNPNGILFNPINIVNALRGYILGRKYSTDDLFFHHDLWGSWDHHTRFSSIDPQLCVEKINNEQSLANDFLKKTGWLILTLGSSFVYELQEGKVVANCHKVPTDKFVKRLVGAEEIVANFSAVFEELKVFNPDLKIIFTISPVRHLRDGFVENNRSKANLIQAVHSLVEKYHHVLYFPAYELVIDDLRDYRFFAEDMVHPNYMATNYVWEKFMSCCIDASALHLMKEINVLNAAKAHRPFNPESQQHRNFLSQNLDRAVRLQSQYDYLDLTNEISFFKTHF